MKSKEVEKEGQYGLKPLMRVQSNINTNLHQQNNRFISFLLSLARNCPHRDPISK